MDKHLSHISEQELLAMYRTTADKQYMGTVLMRYTTVLLGVCQKYLKDVDMAEDMVQQIILKVLDRKHTEVYENFGGWLYTITRNACLTQISKINYTTAIENVQVEDESTDIKAYIQKEYDYNRLNEALHLLNEDQKNCIILFFLQDKSYQEIAETLNIPIKQVKSNIQNGKRNLKIKLTSK